MGEGGGGGGGGIFWKGENLLRSKTVRKSILFLVSSSVLFRLKNFRLFFRRRFHLDVFSYETYSFPGPALVCYLSLLDAVKVIFLAELEISRVDLHRRKRRPVHQLSGRTHKR